MVGTFSSIVSCESQMGGLSECNNVDNGSSCTIRYVQYHGFVFHASTKQFCSTSDGLHVMESLRPCLSNLMTKNLS